MISLLNSNLEIKPLNLSDLLERSAVISLYENSFPNFERKPFSMIVEGLQSHKMKAYSIYFHHKNQKDYIGLAFLIVGEKADILDYLAIHPAYQNHHFGSTILAWFTQQDKPFFVEIESTKTPKEDLLPGGSSKEDIVRRKNFYLRNGLVDCHQEIYLFQARMELLASKSGMDFEAYWQVMANYLGAKNLPWGKENVRLIEDDMAEK